MSEEPEVEGEILTIATSLTRLLADTYTVYLKTQGFHWNVEGPEFIKLHELFEQQYVELRAAVDVIAERIRALGVYAPGSYSQMAELTAIEDTKIVPDAREMLRVLLADHLTLMGRARPLVEMAAKAEDHATADLVTQRLQVHEKTSWMMRSLLK